MEELIQLVSRKVKVKRVLQEFWKLLVKFPEIGFLVFYFLIELLIELLEQEGIFFLIFLELLYIS